MGYDCTLHLVDEKAIREEFVPRLLGESRKKTALERTVKDAAELLKTTRDALKGNDPEEAASLVCQLAIMFSACSLPHQYERGFALSLWGEFPFEFDPQPLFAAVVKKYPKLRGEFPTSFSGNYSTGVYISSDEVPAVLAWVEKTVKKLAKGEQRQFKGLLGILRAAADKKLAYWEATDLAVPPAGQFPGDPRLMLANYLGNEPGSASDKVEAAPIPGHFDRYGCAVLDNWLVGTYDPSHYEQTGPPETNFWDMSVWPPPLKYSLSEFVAYQAHAGDGRWLLISETDPKAAPRNFRPRLFTDLGKKCAGQFPVIIDGTEQYVNTRFGGFVEDRLLVLAHVPMWLEGKHWTPAPGFPNAASDIPAVKGIVDLNDGSDVVIWDGDGYELRGKRFVKTFSMAATGLRRHWTYAPAGADGFFYLSNRLLFEVHRGNQPTPHATRWTNIMYIRPGPAGSILLQEGDNKDGDVAKLYFPADDTFIHIEPELFDDKEYAFIAWSEKADRFVVAAEKFLAVRTATVLALPRYRVSTGKKVKS